MGERIAKRRRSLGLKQVQANEMMERSDKYLSNIEKASSIPSIDVLMKICEVLDTTPDYLLLGTIQGEEKIEENIIQKIKILAKQKGKIEKLSSFLDWAIENDF
ncbi:MAG: helix-turn-helix domain-containing protein [Oscillospiraceae bacterium]|nr:helix-turn-helix domain-containing protein [Oscillospiraceae bacterium]